MKELLKMIGAVATALFAFMVLLVFDLTASSCSSEADRVSYNLSQEADNFNISFSNDW